MASPSRGPLRSLHGTLGWHCLFLFYFASLVLGVFGGPVFAHVDPTPADAVAPEGQANSASRRTPRSVEEEKALTGPSVVLPFVKIWQDVSTVGRSNTVFLIRSRINESGRFCVNPTRVDPIRNTVVYKNIVLRMGIEAGSA